MVASVCSALSLRGMFQLATRVGPPAALAAALAGCAGGNGSTSLPGVDSLSHTQSVVQTGTFTLTDANSGSTSFAPLALTWPKGAPAAGDVLVACSEAQWQTTPQTPTGWTALLARLLERRHVSPRSRRAKVSCCTSAVLMN